MATRHDPEQKPRQGGDWDFDASRPSQLAAEREAGRGGGTSGDGGADRTRPGNGPKRLAAQGDAEQTTARAPRPADPDRPRRSPADRERRRRPAPGDGDAQAREAERVWEVERARQAARARDAELAREAERAREVAAVRNAREPAPPERPSRRRRKAEKIGEPRFKAQRRPKAKLPFGQLLLIPFIALIALGSAGLAGYAISREPKTATLQSQMAVLQHQLASQRHQIVLLKHGTTNDASVAAVTKLTKTVDDLKHTVAGLQNRLIPLQAKLQALNVCLPQLQGELGGETIVHHGKHAGISTVGVSPGCAALLNQG